MRPSPFADNLRVSRGTARVALALIVIMLVVALVLAMMAAAQPARGAAVDEAELCKDGCVNITMTRGDFERLRARMQRCSIEGQWL